MALRQALLAVIAPQACVLCAASTRDLPICGACTRELPWNDCACPGCALPQTHDRRCSSCSNAPPAFDRAWTGFRFAAPVQQSVHGLKYRAAFLHARLLGSLMAQRLTRRAQPLPQLIIPVPLHRSRLIRRGYNQALELAHVISAETNIPCDRAAAQRLGRTEDQIGKTAAQRRANMKGAFHITRALEGLHVALLDDVMTTGATLSELARVCRKAGAARIEAWAAARVA